MEKQNCFKCKEPFDPRDLFETDRGSICESCASEMCYLCNCREPECELSNGEYVCVECYSGMCDRAYENYKDRNDGY